MNENDELDEKDFIQEQYPKDPGLFWIWTAAFVALMAMFWGIGSWYNQSIDTIVEESPFLQVSNRDMSLFLWQFPEHMRKHVSSKEGYLTGFDYMRRVGIREGQADKYVVAPPQLLFLYHTWKRLLSNEVPLRIVPEGEFEVFLNENPEWRPNNWEDAPKEYVKKRGEVMELPEKVHLAFQGWKNYFMEGASINEMTVRYDDLEKFLLRYPHYARNFWQNILSESYPNYLKSFTEGDYEGGATVPKDEIAPFLKVTLFNEKMKSLGK